MFFFFTGRSFSENWCHEAGSCQNRLGFGRLLTALRFKRRLVDVSSSKKSFTSKLLVKPSLMLEDHGSFSKEYPEGLQFGVSIFIFQICLGKLKIFTSEGGCILASISNPSNFNTQQTSAFIENTYDIFCIFP